MKTLKFFACKIYKNYIFEENLFFYTLDVFFFNNWFFFFRVAEKDKTIQGLQSDIEVQKKEATKLLEQAETQKKKNNVSVFKVHVHIMYTRKACSM